MLPPAPSSPTFPFISHFPLHFHANLRGHKKKIPCYVIYSDAAGLSIHTRGKPVGLAPGHGLPFIKSVSVESKAGYVDGKTVWHTDHKDVSYEFDIMGHLLLRSKIKQKARLIASYFSFSKLCSTFSFMVLQSHIVVFSQGSLSNFVGFLLVMTLNPCKLHGVNNASRSFHQNNTQACLEA